MEIEGKVALVTGGAHGLGEALCRRLHAGGAAGIAVVDLDAEGASRVADEVGGLALTADVGREEDVARVVADASDRLGGIDIFISNAGITEVGHPFSADEVWQRVWQVNAMSNVYAARYVLPGMLEKGAGYLVSTASSNGLTTSPYNMAYAMTKHAQVAAAEWLAMVYGSRGIRVSCFCPRWMWTEITRRKVDGLDVVPTWMQMSQEGAVTAEEAADIVADGIAKEQFLILTGEDTLRDFRLKAQDFDAWIGRLQQWHDEMQPEVGPAG